MEIKELGEFGLIRHLTANLPTPNPETHHAIGDDCAILHYDQTRDILITTDLLLEGVHFDLQYTPLRHLGYKSAIVNLSDIYAMGGRPRQMTISLGISRRFTVSDLDDLYTGIRQACQQHHCDIVGGDTTSSRTGLTISITVVGDIPTGKAITRSGAKPTDLICVSGDLGAAYMGLQLLEREKAVYNQQIAEAQARGQKPEQLPPFEPDFAGREYILERQLKPEARADIIQALHDAHLQPTSMIDISDGLSSELHHICHQSHTGCRIYEERIPLDYQTAAMAEELNLSVTTAALNGGEDYELLFTLPLTDHDRIATLPGITIIGHMTPPEQGLLLIGRDHTEIPLKAQGWNHLSPAEK